MTLSGEALTCLTRIIVLAHQLRDLRRTSQAAEQIRIVTALRDVCDRFLRLASAVPREDV